MSDIHRLADIIHARWDSSLRPLHLKETCPSKSSSVLHYDASILRLAFNMLTEQRIAQTNHVSALLADTSSTPRIINKYVEMLKGKSAATAAHRLPSGEVLLPTPVGNFLIGPYCTTHGIKDVKAVILTTPSRADSLPRLAEFTDKAFVGEKGYTIGGALNIDGLRFECTEFTCKLSFGAMVLGKLDLLDAYINDVWAIDNANAYMRAWDLYIEDYLHRAKHTIDVVSDLLRLERQSRAAKPDQDPTITNIALFKRALKPLVDVTEIARQAFCRSLMSATLEGRIIDAQIATLNNAITRSKSVIDPKFPRISTPANMAEAIRALQTLFDLPYHVKSTYRGSPILGNMEINVTSSSNAPFIMQDPIAVRRIIDEIVYRAMLNQKDKPQEISFNFNHAKGEIDVSYGRPQPYDIVRGIKRVAARFVFMGGISYRQSPEGINGLLIKHRMSQGTLEGGLGGRHVSSTSHYNYLNSVRSFANIAPPLTASSPMISSATAFCAGI